ncbi:MAG: hypothetical protein UU62_C0002G0007 [Candidatus Uhrbacteria bacterium GW2011_GWF2_41_40]|nr:MAG: hypothetical protein UU62_C0002G0007 [Candidatus Uhrbacteria bacterium GW2011_GWF2_41_40]
MANNIEKFGKPKSMKDLELEEGLLDYKEEKIEAATEERRERAQKALEKRELERAEEKELWQKRVDDLFQSGNFDEIKTLLRARPELKPKPEIVRTRLNDLITSRPSNWERIFSDIQNISDILPDSTVVEQEFSALFSQFGNEKNILDQLKALKKITGFTPSQEQIQGKYRAILKGYNFNTEDLFKDIQSLTGVKPERALFDEVLADGRIDNIKKYAPLFGVELSSEMVQAIYESHFAKYGSLPISQLPEKPNADLMHRIYAKIIEQRDDRWITVLQELEKATGVKPIFSAKQVQSIFEDFLSKGWYGRIGYIGIEQVVDLTGMHPSPEAIQKRALQIVDGGHHYIDQGKRIKDSIQAFEAATGKKVEIPEQEIQARYQQAMTDRKAHVISNLYGAFGVKPTVDKETARKFIVSFVDDTYHNPVQELANVFGITFEVIKKEVAEKFDEALEGLNFDKVRKIQEITGEQPSRKKLEVALQKKLEQEALRPRHDRGSYDRGDWPQQTKALFEKFGATIPEKIIVGLYDTLIDNEVIYTDSLEKLHEMSGVSILPALAQKAYEKILSTDYSASVTTKEGSTYSYGRASAIEKIFQMSANTPVSVAEEQVQKFYRSRLEDYWGGISDISKLAEVTGISPQFDSADVNQIYRKWLLEGSFDRVKRTQEAIGIALQLDEETREQLSQSISEDLAKATSENYTREEYGNKKFDSYGLKEDLKKVAQLIETSGVRPNPEKVQQMYDSAIASDPYPFTVIDSIAKTTGIKPQFTPKQVQQACEKFLQSGRLAYLEALLEYGQPNFDPALVESAYHALLRNAAAEWDKDGDYGNYEYFTKNFADRLLELQKMSGVEAGDDVLAQAFLRNVSSNRRSYYAIEDGIKFLKEKFGRDIDQPLAQEIYVAILKEKNLGAIGVLKKETQIKPEIPNEVLLATVDELIQNNQFKDLAYLKQELELEHLPVSEELVDAKYTQLTSAEDFTKDGSASNKEFFTLYSLTGIQPQITEEQLEHIFKNSQFENWQPLAEALRANPSPEAVQEKYYQYLIARHWKLKDDLAAIEHFSNVAINETTVQRALNHCAATSEIEKIIAIEEATGMNPEIDAEAIQQGYKQALADMGKNAFKNSIAEAINYFYGERGVAPDQEVLGLMYAKLVGETAYEFSFQKDGKREYPQWWDVLKEKFGMASDEAVQKTYFSVLNKEKLSFRELQNLKFIQEFTGSKPNIDEMVGILSEQGITREALEYKLRSFYQKELLAGRIENIKTLAEQWGVPFEVSAAEAQMIYAKILFGDDKLQEQQYKFMAEHSDHLPDGEIIQNKYRELLLGELKDSGSIDINKVFDIWDLTGIEPPQELVAEADGKWLQSHINLIRYVQLLGSQDFENLFPKKYTKIVEQMGEKLAEDVDLADYFFENLHTYYTKPWTADYLAKAVWHYSVAKKFKDALEQGGAVWSSQPWIEAVSQQAHVAIDQGPPHDEWGDQDEHHGGEESESFIQEDPFENHPLRKIRSSLGLGRVMAEKITPAEAGLELSAEAIEALREINGILENEHESFLERFDKNSAVSEEDKIALTGQSQSKVKMNNLLPNVRNFVGRYLAQLANGDPEKLSEIIISQKDSVKRMVQEGYRRYLKIYEVDIPLYDKLYEEFDHWREAGRYPMEVYLGRDGIYAYIGRRAQDATRRSKVGRKKREQLRSEGEVIEINPKYLVYPRYFRDYINYDTKRAFLEQEQISPDMDPLFYDTGYTGTIPEQIMRVMGFDQTDIEERIRLLSAPSAKRRVKDIPENARSEIIEYIEHNAKTENTAVGLFQDEKTGKIRHVARPTEPEEQFYFMMIKQAIARHYVVQERLDFEAPENANYDSEDYYIRVRQEYADILPADFIKNPKQYFEQQGILLKGSKGEGEYPDEEILSFKLEDGTEVIAKRVELRKSKEARKEFMILIASKKAGLSTAEPIGFLSGKKEEDGSYLLMEKLEGYSGRKFEKYLQESGKFTDEQITGIMKTVAEKLKDLAQMFRDQLNIDKRWRIKDTIIQFNEETGEVEGVIPIDWERVKTYDPNKPQKIDLVE